MEFDLTPVIEALVLLISVLITRYLIPWIKRKTTLTERENVLFVVELAVKAAQQLGKNYDWDGEKKKEYVVNYLNENGFTVDDTIDNYIEAMVLELKSQLVDE